MTAIRMLLLAFQLSGFVSCLMLSCLNAFAVHDSALANASFFGSWLCLFLFIATCAIAIHAGDFR